jgi:adenosylmethionine-8-amino-7-oxononanoate aminotransferase
MSAEIWRPFTQMQGFRERGRVVEARGAWLNFEDGHRAVDGISSWWVNTHGHAHPKIAEAIADQARRFDQVILADFSHGPVAQLTQTLGGILPGEDRRIFYSDNGSTAVEVALKMALQAKKHLGEPERRGFVSFTGAYHGDTLGAMSVGARGIFNEPMWDLLFDCTELPYGDIGALRQYLESDGQGVAAVIMEPLVQGAAGLVFSSPEYLRACSDLCRQFGCFLILDEVMTGWGRTGTMFACEQAGVVPDLLAASKGVTGGTLPLGVTACSPQIYEAFLGDSPQRAFLHGHSYTGNPIACAAANAAMALYAQEGTLQRVAAIEYQYKAASPLFEGLDGVENIRQIGGIFAFDLRGEVGGYLDPIGRRVCDRTFEMGLYTRPLGNTCYLMPPFCIGEAELETCLDQLFESVRAELSA